MAPSLGEASPTIMKGILIAGVFAAFAITVIDSLDCRQCSSTEEGIKNCMDDASPCGESAEYVSCVESLVNSTLGEAQSLYQHRYCSTSNCKDIPQADFTVHVSDVQQFHFASQCCEGKPCSDNKDSGPQNLTNTQCSSCYSNNPGTCNETTQQCFEGERCVHIIVQSGSDDDSVTEELKGCSDISDATCEALDANVKVGEFTFQTVNCTNATTIPVTTTPTTVTTTPDSSTSIKASFISSVFGSLLLLKLLF